MNVYVKALLDTIMFVVYIAAIYFGVTYILDTYNLTGLYVLTGLIAGVALYGVYSISLTRRKYQASKASQ